MLESIRENSQGVVAKSILGLVILTFAVAGVGSYTSQVDTSVATVNGVKITQSEFDRAFQAQRNRMQQQFGEMFDTLSSDANYMANLRNNVLDNLINEALIDQNSNDLAIRVSDEKLKQAIREMPEFQVDGSFDNDRYLALIQQAGFFQSSDFRDYLRVEMTRRQLTQSLLSTEFDLPYRQELTSALQNQKRNIRYAVIDAEQFKAQVEVTDEEVSAFYQDNQDRFQNQEQVKVDYVVLSVNDYAQDVVVSDEEISAYYEENIEAYSTPEQRRVSHILIESGEDADAAKAKAEAILARIQAGEDFAELAKTESDDMFSGENGGDLEYLEKGVMEESFEVAAFALENVGDVTEVVETSFGFHIVKLTELTDAQVEELASVSPDIKEMLANDKAQGIFFEKQQEAAQLAFEVPDSLEDAANAVGVEVQTSEWLSRFGNDAPFDNAQIIEVAFDDVLINDQVNSDVIEVSEEEVVFVRVNEYQAATVKPLSEVSEDIKTQLIAEKATTAADVQAAALLASFKAGEDVNEQLTALNSSFESKVDVARFGADIDGAVRREAFTLPHPAEGVVSASTVTMSNGNIALVEVEAVTAGEASVNPNLAQQQTQMLATAAYAAYVKALRVDADITRKEVIESTNVL
ncbi:SurA N-terminal domain-containing protein [Thalassotalea agarivorans]|uniref:Periplasmic chaperone PpiD n=1 Tax=Thalassotalea agarivorans TaxID=349064 RepID=A0A1H9ZPS9_THASX|nr:SurA N-terminal domain-containing protein [Thalassotalea agarivorans]SES83742.1 peptidyl-prolyl cis-trans isomerase D [Thalassotalea agarivorans]